ncbi:hypothetical protein DFH27DRAFT_636422 [Peziza echinospora]|nr:hypothetical protein DFH27DRAFT_636422 [Peziza echinospora]
MPENNGLLALVKKKSRGQRKLRFADNGRTPRKGIINVSSMLAMPPRHLDTDDKVTTQLHSEPHLHYRAPTIININTHTSKTTHPQTPDTMDATYCASIEDYHTLKHYIQDYNYNIRMRVSQLQNSWQMIIKVEWKDAEWLERIAHAAGVFISQITVY